MNHSAFRSEPPGKRGCRSSDASSPSELRGNFVGADPVYCFREAMPHDIRDE